MLSKRRENLRFSRLLRATIPSMERPRRGFTVLEVLVATAVIGLLATVIFASLGGSREKARDVDRLNDMQQLQIALRLFAEQNGRYPSAADGTCAYTTAFDPGGCLEALVTQGFLTELPTDPEDEPFTGSWPNTQMYYYDNWCRDVGTNDDQFRAWANGETDHGATAYDWWFDNTIGVTTCDDPS